MDTLNRHRRLSWTAMLVLAVVFVWLLWPDRRLAQVKALQQQLFSAEGKKLSADDRKQKFQELREASKKLSDAQKKELAKEGQERFQQDLERYAKMSKTEQIAYLDRQLDRTEAARKKMKESKGPAGNGNQKGKGGKEMSAADRERMRKQRLDHSTPEFRAMMDRYRKDLQARAAARGIPASPWSRRLA